jgi:hypothetical protein
VFPLTLIRTILSPELSLVAVITYQKIVAFGGGVGGAGGGSHVTVYTPLPLCILFAEAGAPGLLPVCHGARNLANVPVPVPFTAAILIYKLVPFGI